MESLHSSGTITQINTEKSHQINFNSSIAKEADTTDLAASVCSFDKNNVENDKYQAVNGELNPLFVSQFIQNGQNIGSGSSFDKAISSEFSESENKVESKLEKKGLQNSEDVDEENDEEIVMDFDSEEEEALEDVNAREFEALQAEQEINTSEFGALQAEQEINRGKSEVAQGNQETNEGASEVAQGAQEINTGSLAETTAINTIEMYRETFINTFILTPTTLDEAKKNLETGNFQNITDVKDPNVNNRVRMDPKNLELVVPKGSFLLQLNEPVIINGKEYTIRAETDVESEEFEKNWGGYTKALQASVGVKEETKNEDSKETKAQERQATPSRSKEGPLSGKQQDELSVKMQTQIAEAKRNSLKLLESGQTSYREKQKEWRAEDITKAVVKEEIATIREGKERLNAGHVKQIISKSTETFKSVSPFKITISNSHFAKIILLATSRRKFA